MRRRTWLLGVVMALALPRASSKLMAAGGTQEPGRFRARALVAESQEQATRRKARSRNGLVSVLVKLDNAPLAGYKGGVAGFAATASGRTGSGRLNVSSAAARAYLGYLDRRHRDFEASAARLVPEARIVHRFKVVFGGVSVLVPRNRVSALARIPGVRGVYRDELLQLSTEKSPNFIGASSFWDDPLHAPASRGDGVIVGVLDSGVWPEHPSYSDPDAKGNAYPAPPVVPGSNGFGSGGPRSTCDFGNTVFNPSDAPFTCNNKLIGAYAFLNTYKAIEGLIPEEFDSARDDNGHGTHTSSTAAGNQRVVSTLLGVSRGNVSGMAPRAHIIMYRVCANEGCFGSDSVRAVEQAILDGVNVINFSISGGTNPYSDAVELAFLDAYDAGVFVAASAGNDGPGANTVSHRGPWVTTIAASTSNRHFIADVTLTADNADTLDLSGATVTEGISSPTNVVLASAFGDGICLNPFAPGTFSGEIVVCERGINARVAKSFNVMAGGASGMLLYNPALQGLATDNHFIPSVHLENDAGALLLAFMASHTGVMGTFTGGVSTNVPGDVMGAFSSRGGSGQTLGVSKPDVTAPGVQILAGMSPMPATIEGGLPGELFQAIQGTSMSSPHAAGAGALLKGLFPTWTPGQIKSALMTTARQNVVNEDGVTPTTPFDDGSGRINLKKADKPGILFDETAASYFALENNLWDANYPSLYLPVNPGSMTVSRSVQSTSATPTVWKLRVNSPPDLDVDTPNQVALGGFGSASFDIEVDARNVPLGEVRHANLRLQRGSMTANFPISVVRRNGPVLLDKTCTLTSIPRGGLTDCTVSFTNTLFEDAALHVEDVLPNRLELVAGSVSGATETSSGFVFDGLVGAASPPDVNVDPGSSPAGYLPLSLFGVTPIGGMGDETLANFNTPAFLYGGETYTRLGVVSNGYVVVGGGTGADIDFMNQIFPDPERPNNVLAPFWTDLNVAAGGAVRIATLTDGVNTWIVVDWQGVANFTVPSEVNSFQIWIQIGAVEEISYAFGPIATGADGFPGDLNFLTVGAENRFGNRGDNHYANGSGSAPVAGTELVVTTSPPAPGETHTVTFSARGKKKGAWQNCAEMTSAQITGTVIDCVSGQVNP